MGLKTLKGRIAIITGASSGIGWETAQLFAREGAHVVVAARRQELLDDLKQRIEQDGGRADVVVTDVSQKAQVDALIQNTWDRHKQLDVLVNNAGIGGVHVFLEMTDAEVQRMIDVNFMSMVWACRAAIPLMVKQGRGHIVNVASVNALKGTPMSTIYSATKFGMRGLTESLRLELKGSGVSLSCVNPGFTDTAMAQGVLDHLEERGESVPGAPMSPEKVARAIRDAIVKDRHEITLTAGGRALAVVNRISVRFANWIIGSFGPMPEIPEHLRPEKD